MIDLFWDEFMSSVYGLQTETKIAWKGTNLLLAECTSEHPKQILQFFGKLITFSAAGGIGGKKITVFMAYYIAIHGRVSILEFRLIPGLVVALEMRSR